MALDKGAKAPCGFQAVRDAPGMREACARLASACQNLGADAIVERMRRQGVAHLAVLDGNEEREVA